MSRTRLAPSPTGALHLGNARTFLINWLMARQNGWKILLRIEDLDSPRVKSGAERMVMEDLAYLGVDWDEGPVYQSKRTNNYAAAVRTLLDRKLAYPCVCTRREVELAASAPHAEDGASVYPGTCRGRFASVKEAAEYAGRTPAIRFAAADKKVEFEDGFLGRQAFNVGRDLGDFVIAKADGTAAYQLAVVVDDLAAGVDEIVRGNDLLESTPRQILLYEALEAAERIPRYTHLPLVVGSDGRRLAKRHGDTRLETYRKMGVKESRVLALVAKWCGIEIGGDTIEEPGSLLERFRIDRVPRGTIVFGAEDDAFLRGGI
jgi:glutamyl-tRNA synthetase